MIEIEDFLNEAVDVAMKRQERLKTKIEPCPLCGSNQIQLCLDYNNPTKDLAKCRECKCQAPLLAWNNRKPYEA